MKNSDHQRNEGHVTDSTVEISVTDNTGEPMEDRKRNGTNIMEINDTCETGVGSNTWVRQRKTCPANT